MCHRISLFNLLAIALLLLLQPVYVVVPVPLPEYIGRLRCAPLCLQFLCLCLHGGHLEVFLFGFLYRSLASEFPTVVVQIFKDLIVILKVVLAVEPGALMCLISDIELFDILQSDVMPGHLFILVFVHNQRGRRQ
jgi:hypothetical protein